jgi:hypothetical protein
MSISLDRRFGAWDNDEDHAAALEDAREALAYWEDRERRLPRHRARGRREARAMAARWRGRVTAAERAVYGRGLTGALLLVATERRLPEGARRTGRTLVRRAVQVAAALTVAAVALAAVAVVVVVKLLGG